MTRPSYWSQSLAPTRRRVTALAVAAVALAAPVLLVSPSPTDASSVTITLYSGQHPESTATLVSAFEARTHIHVNVRNDDEAVLADEIVTEGSRSPADVFFTENSPALQYLAEKGRLAPVESSTLAKVAAKYDSPKGLWVGVSARVSVLDYNTDSLRPKQLPTSVLDLAKPVWKGKLALAPAETDFQPIITSIAKQYGNAKAISWLEGIKANAQGHIYPDNETVTAQINAGRAEIALIDHYYWYRLKADLGAKAMHSALSYFAPGDAGYVLDVSGAGILASSQHKSAAQQFLAFLVSTAGEQIIANSDSFEYPLGSGVRTSKPLKAFTSLRPTTLSIANLGDGQHAVSLLQQVGLL